MSLYVGITDKGWYEQLKAANAIEANFWRPGGSTFRRIEPGELFLFKLRSPENFIVGGGHFLRYLQLPMSLAWSAFEQRNGCETQEEFRQRLVRLRPENAEKRDPNVGCILLAETFWLDQNDWIPVPGSWHVRIQSGIGYDPGDPEHDELLAALAARKSTMAVREPLAAYGRDYVAVARLGQGAFRALVTESYNRRCAVTGERTLPALDAAHIQPFSVCRAHKLSNGVLLRADLHRLFDEGLVTITPDLRLEVSDRIREEYENGRDYYAMHGQELKVTPTEPHARPDPAMLEWHNTNLFAG